MVVITINTVYTKEFKFNIFLNNLKIYTQSQEIACKFNKLQDEIGWMVERKFKYNFIILTNVDLDLDCVFEVSIKY